MHNLNLINNPG